MVRAKKAAVPSHLLFEGQQLQHAGDLLSIALLLKDRGKGASTGEPLIFEVASGRQIDIDLRGSRAALEARFGTPANAVEQSVDVPAHTGRGRPRLGVVGREVTLLPRHWTWLESQRGGASAALRRLVDQARQANADEDRRRAAQDRGHRFMTVMAGDLPGYEEATRHLFADERSSFLKQTRAWPKDVRVYARALAADAFSEA
ncbi:MAG: DUF2239 family protein [Pseudomonadales bacterium]